MIGNVLLKKTFTKISLRSNKCLPGGYFKFEVRNRNVILSNRLLRRTIDVSILGRSPDGKLVRLHGLLAILHSEENNAPPATVIIKYLEQSKLAQTSFNAGNYPD